MKRFLTTTVTIIVCFILQCTVFKGLELADVVPNLLLIVTVAAGYMRGRKEGMLVGFVCGILIDFVYGDIIGVRALIYMYIGYLNGVANRVYYRDDFTVPIILVGISDFLFSFSFYVLTFLLNGRLNILFYIRRIMLPQLVYTVLVSVVLYKLLHKLNTILEKSEEEE